MNAGSAERGLILLAAGTAARRDAGRPRALALATVVDWEQLAVTLHRRRLLPTLGPRIEDLCGGRTDDKFSAHVERALAQTRRQGAFLQLISARITAALRDAGVRCAPLKGPGLSEALYGDPGRRLASDIDLLVAPEQLVAALTVVSGFGYGEPIDHVDEDGVPELHFAVSHRSEELPPVELHWRIHWYERRFAAERLLPPPGADPAWRPAAIDELAALLLFYARDGFVDLRLATDIGAFWDVRGAETRSADFAALLSAYPPLRRPLLAAAVAAERVVGLPAADLLAATPSPDLRSRLAVRLANPNPSPRSRASQIHAAIGLVDGLLTPPGELRDFVRRQILLAPDHLDEQAQKLSRSPRSQFGHGARTLARIGFAGTRLARPSEAVR
ncbi:MAG: nucleotidyltransferase family protein [Solirubrobacterales bacterium]